MNDMTIGRYLITGVTETPTFARPEDKQLVHHSLQLLGKQPQADAPGGPAAT